MLRQRLIPATALVLIGGAVAASAAPAITNASPAQARAAALPLENPSMIVVYSGPDQDAQLFISTGSKTPMAQLAITAPDGRRVFAATFPGPLGQSDLRLDTPEPTLAQLETDYPAGAYRWTGRTTDGRRLTGTSRLRYTLLEPPVITAPGAGSSVAPASLVARWQPVAGARRIHLELEQVKTHRLLTIDLDGASSSFRIPVSFVKPGLEYVLDVKAANASGNLSVADVTFRIA